MSKEYELLKKLIETTLAPEDRKPYLDALKKICKPDIQLMFSKLIDAVCDVYDEYNKSLVEYQKYDVTDKEELLSPCVTTLEEQLDKLEDIRYYVEQAIEEGKSWI